MLPERSGSTTKNKKETIMRKYLLSSLVGAVGVLA